MPRLKKEEVIELYKRPHSMDVDEIWRYSGFFTSKAMINRYINQGREDGTITEEDDEIFRKRKEAENKENKKNEEKLLKIVLEKFLNCKTQREIVQEIKTELGITITEGKLRKILNEIVTQGILSQEQYDAII